MAATTAVGYEGPQPLPPVQERISEVTQALLGACGLDRQDLAPVLGIAASGVGRALNGKRRWTPDDIDTMAHFFTHRLDQPIDPGLFFKGGHGLFGQNWKKISRPDLRIVDGGGETDRRLGALRLV